MRESAQLQREADSWLRHYNTRRHNHSDYMRHRRPIDILNNHPTHTHRPHSCRRR